MRVAVAFSGYNPRRYKRPYILKVTAWPIGKKPTTEFGTYVGGQSGGEVEIEAEVNDIIKYGQTDTRKESWKSERVWAIVRAGGELERVTEAEAAKLFRLHHL